MGGGFEWEVYLVFVLGGVEEVGVEVLVVGLCGDV